MKTFAISLYDNEAESDDELNFQANDLFQILQIDYLGMDGWYLCKLIKTNRVGLAAGNRLKIINDDKQLMAKFNSILSKYNNSLNQNNFNNSPSKTVNLNSSISSIFSTCSSNISNVSSSNVSSPIESPIASNIIENSNANNPDFFKINQQPLVINSKPQSKLVLPAKNQLGNSSKLQLNFKPLSSSDTIDAKTLKSSNEKQNKLENIDDDYDYDIPENNKPTTNSDEDDSIESVIKNLKIENSLNETTTVSKVESNHSNSLISAVQTLSRKSASPTIDSGISTSSLISLNSDNFLSILSSSVNENSAISSSSSSTNRSSTTSNDITSTQAKAISKQQLLENDFKEKLETLCLLCVSVKAQADNIKSSSDLNEIKTHLTHIKHLYEEFLIKVLKRIKQEHACFHPDLNVFNKFKTNYRQLKEFYLFYETHLSDLDKILKWNYDLIIGNREKNFNNEFTDLISKLPYLQQLLDLCKNIVTENFMFQYQQESTLSVLKNTNESSLNEARDNEEDDSYAYEYDNNDRHYSNIDENEEQTYENEGDYCVIDELDIEEPPNKNESQNKRDNGMCLTLKKNEEKIRREIRLTTSNTESETSRITMCDQMLLKFYLKHIEENLNELNHMFQMLNNEFSIKSPMSSEVNEMANKLALNGHKLLFICDTLERNLNNKNLKQTLGESSMSLCESLQLYQIRLKNTTSSLPIGNMTTDDVLSTKQNQLIKDSLVNVFNSANIFKQNILKYYFKSF